MISLSQRLASPLMAAACLWACQPQTAPQTNTTQQPIINGMPCDAAAEPTALAILVDTTLILPVVGPFPMKSVICTGSLIAPDVVLTAAHCVDDVALGQGIGMPQDTKFFITFQPDLVPLAAGETMNFPSEIIEASAWIKHEGFDINSLTNVNGPGDYRDIGLIFLKTPVTTVEPERVITTQEAQMHLVQGATVSMAGWGASTPDPGNILMPPPRGTVGRKVCGSSSINEIGSTEFQVGAGPETTRKCKGDSGGPSYLVVDPNAQFPRRVVGVTSHAYDMSLCQKGGLDTRVDSYLDWIDQKMKAGCMDGTRSWCRIPGIIPPSEGPVKPDGPFPTPDAGMAMPDAGQSTPDSGSSMPMIDAGVITPDSGTKAEVDAGQSGSTDVGNGNSGGTLDKGDGCTCAAPSQQRLGLGSSALMLILVGFFGLRRRR